MKFVQMLLVSALLVMLGACASEKDDEENQPTAPWTYPISEYRVVQKLASRSGADQLTRLTGWDGEFYYFDWSQQTVSISRGTAKVEREQFRVENRGALTLSKGLLTVQNGQVRNLELR